MWGFAALTVLFLFFGFRDIQTVCDRLLPIALERIYFAYDADEISADQRAILDAKLPILLANPRVHIRVAGHTDERGADEYNLALGQRRAASVKRYFTARGVGDERIETVSFGREHPLTDGHDEDSWAKNRRGEFEIIAGGETLRAPR